MPCSRISRGGHATPASPLAMAGEGSDGRKENSSLTRMALMLGRLLPHGTVDRPPARAVGETYSVCYCASAQRDVGTQGE